jgi:hypothetical protein
VRAILDGHWTNEPPAWANSFYSAPYLTDSSEESYTRAVQTAEAFIVLFTEWNSRFDRDRFLIACGLVDAPVKTRVRRADKAHG